MKLLRYPRRAKWIVSLAAVLFGVAVLFGLLAIMFTNEMELYDKPLEKVIEKHQQDLKKYYAVKIIDCREKGKAFPVVPNLEYGIVGSYDTTIDDLFVSDISNYTYTNFYETKPNSESYIIRYVGGLPKNYPGENYEVSEYHVGSPTLISSLMGNGLGSISSGNPVTRNVALIEQIVFNKDDGIFYFETSRYSFPIRNISVDSLYVQTEDDISRDRLMYHEYFTLNEDIGLYESDSGYCEPLDTSDYKKWFHMHGDQYKVYVEDIREIDEKSMLPREVEAENVEVVTEIVEEGKSSQQEGSNRQGENVTKKKANFPYLQYELPYNSEMGGAFYWVVMNVRKDIDTGSDDLFARQQVFLTYLHKLRYPFIGVTFLCAMGFLFSLGLLVFTVQQVHEQGGISILFWHKIPLLVYLGMMGTLILGSLCLADVILQKFYSGECGGQIAFTLILIPAVLSVFLVVLLWTNVVTRYYGKVFWRNTVSFHLVVFGKRFWGRMVDGIRLCREHISLLLKGGMAFLGIGLLELFAILLNYLMTNGDGDIFFIGWMVLKVIQFPIVCVILIQMKYLQEGSKKLAEGNLRSKIDTEKMLWEFKRHGDYLNQISDGMSSALEERLRSERFKTELITNVSHDIKTPLTSIINYVDLLQKPDITQEDREGYLSVLERQSARLKKLIEDLMEASKASTGNLQVDMETCNMDILLTQTIGEFEEKLFSNGLELRIKKQDVPIFIRADSRHLWRIFDNLMNNICKYSQSDTRVYINQEVDEEKVRIIFLNTSKYALNISGDELMERFVRGDTSRNTEGSGLGLSIARSLTELMNGTLRIDVEGDLFKVTISFLRVEGDSPEEAESIPEEMEPDVDYFSHPEEEE